MNRMHRLAVITAVALTLVAGATSPAQAAAPANDRLGSARTATGIGYTDSVNVSQATSGRSDPRNCSSNVSVWYRYRASTTETINVNTSGSNYDTVIGVYTGRPDALTAVRCVDDSFRVQAGLDLQVEAGTTYFFMVAACCGRGTDGQDFGRRLRLQFHMLAPLRVDQLAAADTGTVDRADREAHVVVSRGCDQVADRAFVEASLLAACRRDLRRQGFRVQASLLRYAVLRRDAELPAQRSHCLRRGLGHRDPAHDRVLGSDRHVHAAQGRRGRGPRLPVDLGTAVMSSQALTWLEITARSAGARRSARGSAAGRTGPPASSAA